MRSKVIRSCHDDIGHVSINRIMEYIKRIHWFPNIPKLIK